MAGIIRTGFVSWRQESRGASGGEPYPQDPSRGAQGSRQLCPEEQGWQPPELKRASWNRASCPLGGVAGKQGHAREDLWPSPCHASWAPTLPHPPASFL